MPYATSSTQSPYPGLAVVEHIVWQRRAAVIQRVGIFLLFLFILAALAGLFGGRLIRTTAKAPGLEVTYDRVAHLESPTQVEIRVEPLPAAGQQGVVLFISRSIIESIDFEGVFPEPPRWGMSDDGAAVTFVPVYPGAAARLRVEYRPKWGGVHGVIGIPGGASVEISQLVLP